MTAIDSPEHFWSFVDRTSPGCWEWQGDRYHGYCQVPYGQVFYRPERLSWGAHRIAWMLTYGRQPKGRLVLHWCDNPPCVNPAHLWLGTHVMNAQHAVLKGRHKGAKLMDHYGSRSAA